MEIGNKLKKARNEKGITQEKAADLLGVSRQTVSNWENNRSYPDIVSVIKMSDLYSVSLDNLLKEEKDMDQNYQEFLEESTNTVKAKKNMSKVIIITAYFIIWIALMVIFWGFGSNVTKGFETALKYTAFPLFLLIACIFTAKNDLFGKLKWLGTLIATVTFMVIPYTQSKYVVINGVTYDEIMYRSPNLIYALIGLIVSLLGLVAGTIIRKNKKTVVV